MQRQGPGGRWVVREFSGRMSVPHAPLHPQNLNGAGMSFWPGLLVGDKLLQPCLTLHRETFPGDEFFSRRASDDNVTDQMAGCCYTHESPYFMAQWGYSGTHPIISNRWIGRDVTQIEWSIRESTLANHSFGGDAYDYELHWVGLDANGRPVPGATDTAQVATASSKLANGTSRHDAGRCYGLQLVPEIFSGLPFKDPRRYNEVAWELWAFLPSSNFYVWELSVVVANANSSEPRPVPMDVHGNPADPCRGVLVNGMPARR